MDGRGKKHITGQAKKEGTACLPPAKNSLL